jgi:hypothetical protein
MMLPFSSFLALTANAMTTLTQQLLADIRVILQIIANLNSANCEVVNG